jgi:hypothetical protein
MTTTYRLEIKNGSGSDVRMFANVREAADRFHAATAAGFAARLTELHEDVGGFGPVIVRAVQTNPAWWDRLAAPADPAAGPSPGSVFDHPFFANKPALKALYDTADPKPEHVRACLVELCRHFTRPRPAPPKPAGKFVATDGNGDRLHVRANETGTGAVAQIRTDGDSAAMFLGRDTARELVAWLSAFYGFPEAEPCPTPPTLPTP